MRFSDILLLWYEKNKRPLIWRNTSDLYNIWVSEIILQQTRVSQGTKYYKNFLERFPTIQSLASADENDVLKIWQGLGYYSRARNMHLAAKQIVNDYKGVFPREYNSMIKIKGIGKYTAAALLSIGYNLPYPVIDGNVKRVIGRLYAIDAEINSTKADLIFTEKINSLFDKKRASDFNQAIMEFGALQCKPGMPDCQVCIFRDICMAYKKGEVLLYPKISKKTVDVKRYLYYIAAFFNDRNLAHTFLTKRSKNDIWKNLYEFPLIELDEMAAPEEVISSDKFRRLFPQLKYNLVSVSEVYIHKLTHRLIYAQFIRIEMESSTKPVDMPAILVSDLKFYPVSRLTEKYLLSNNYFES
jgi:A/G-specific adenine glycosylase